MGRLRRFVNKALKPLVMAGVAGTVAVSLIVTTPSNAQAFVPPPVLPAVFGATEMVLPELMATGSVLGPVGWGLAGLAALGIGAYATRDYWLPYVTGAFGGGSSSSPTATASPTPTQTATATPTPTPTATATGGAFNFPAPPADGYGAAAWKNTTSNTGIDLGHLSYNASSHQLVGQISYTGSGTTDFVYQTGFRWTCQRSNGTTYVGTDVSYGVALHAGTTASSTGMPNTGGVCTGSGETLTDAWMEPLRQALGDARGVGATIWTPGVAHPAGNPAYDYLHVTNPTSSPTATPTPTQQFDPRSHDVTYKATVDCISLGGVVTQLTAYSNGDEGGLHVPSCAAAGAGHGTGHIVVWATPPATQPGVTPQPQKVWEFTPPAPAPDKPLCDSTRPGSGCKLKVKLDNQDCVMGLFGCENWAELSKDPNWTPRYSCEYGPYVVALAVCAPLEKGYQPGGAPATNPNIDGDPKTTDNTGPDGKPDPGTNPNPTITPGAGGKPDPNGDPKGKECFPSGWGVFNPLEWVMKPVGCALTAAFVPTNTVVQTQSTRIQDKIKNAGPGKVITAWQTTFNSVGGSSGCSGPAVTFSMEGVVKTLHPFDACSGGMAVAAGVSFAVSSVAIVIFGGLGIARAVSSAFGFNFSFGKGASTE